jgi:hypothetical protein
MQHSKVFTRFRVASAVFVLAICVGGPVYADQAADLVALANRIQNQAPGINFTIGTEKFSYQVSDPVYFTFSADQDCYVAIVDIGTSGKMTLLFPNKWHRDNKIEKGKSYRIPPEGSEFTYKLAGPPGTEHVKVIASVNQLLSTVHSLQQEVKTPLKQTSGGFLTMKNPGLILKDIRVAFSGIEPNKWATGDLTFQVQEAGADSSPSQTPGPAQASGQPPAQ